MGAGIRVGEYEYVCELAFLVRCGEGMMGREAWWGRGWGSKVDGVTLLWVLLIAYFGCAACVCGLGVYGVLKTLPTYIRFYRDFTIASISFTTFFLALATYTSFHGHSRASLCESLSHYPDLLRSLQQSPLLGNLSFELTLSESCEAWLEGAVVVGLAALCLVMADGTLKVQIPLPLPFLLFAFTFALAVKVTRPSFFLLFGLVLLDLYILVIIVPDLAEPIKLDALCANAADLPPPFLLDTSTRVVQRRRATKMVYAPVPLDSLPLEMQVQAMEVLVQQQHQHQGTGGSERPPTTTSGMMSHQRHKSHRRRSSSVLTVGQQERKE
ncbi:hypothetical protein NMY22_g1501 [Coprinellus aureogranulatus]|nr:hypothetical protein NMY22_g1501 [Coprinellus aureogranulatus]